MLIRSIAAWVLALTLAWGALAAVAEGNSAPAGSEPIAGEASDHAGVPAHEGHGDGNPLALDRNLALWTGVVFVLLLLLLWRFAWGPIAAGLDKREQHISDEIAQAEQCNRDAKQTLVDYQQKLAAAQAEVRAILDRGRQDAEQAGRAIVEQARTEAKREQEKAVREIDMAVSGAMQELAQRGADLAVQLAGRIVRAKLSPEEHAQLIRDAVAGLPQVKPSRN
jgi:F-type H+-transporting ATPase subunit b